MYHPTSGAIILSGHWGYSLILTEQTQTSFNSFIKIIIISWEFQLLLAGHSFPMYDYLKTVGQ